MKNKQRFSILAAALSISLSMMNGAVAMQPAPQTPAQGGAKAAPTPVAITEDETGVHVRWSGSVERDENGYPIAQGWEQQTLGAVKLPIYAFVVTLPSNAKIDPLVSKLQSAAWKGGLESAPAKPVLDEDGIEIPATMYAESATAAPPNAPWVITGDSRARGVRIVAMALSPVYASRGQTMAASEINLAIPGAKLFKPSDLQWAADAPGGVKSSPLVADTITAPPINPAALVTSVRITVTNAGIQSISGMALGQAGFTLSSLSMTNTHVFYRGTEIAAQVIDVNANGSFDASDEVRFYAQKPGDRWNKTEIYWMTFDATPGLRMTSRNVTPTGADPITQTVMEEGEWRPISLYAPVYAGLDGDHFFAASMNAFAITSTMNLTLSSILPPAQGAEMLFVQHTTRVSNSQGYTWTLQNTSDGETTTSVSFGVGNITVPLTLTKNATNLRLTLIGPSRWAYVDAIQFTHSGLLDLGGSGAVFRGLSGAYEYRASNVPADSWLYDITNAVQPQALKHITTTNVSFRDSDVTGRRYLISGNGATFSPAIVKHLPSNLNQQLNALEIYIGPADFASAIQPLMALRQTQGIPSIFVNAQAIYDGWSYGRKNPLAIRDFLRYAVKQWSSPPTSVVLVGDAFVDPLNYLYSGVDVVPAFLLPTEPALLDSSGEAPCDACLANLDGDYPVPVNGSYNSSDYLPDLDIGRFPVQNADELTLLVNKIIGYETQSSSRENVWQNRAGYMSDNYVCTTSTITGVCIPGTGVYAGYQVDAAGNFYSSTQTSMAMQPTSVETGCVMYMPEEGPATNDPCYERNDASVKQRAIDLYRNGALMTLYVGHASWDSMAGLSQLNNHLLNITKTTTVAPQNDVLMMDNGLHLPVALEMACYTSKFTQQIANNNNHSIDEQLVLNSKGGAIATWGSTGESVNTGHDALAKGFLTTLWGTLYQPTLGEMTRASRAEAYTTRPCCRDVLYSFTLLGDPMTRIKKVVSDKPYAVYMPIISR